MQQYPKTVTLLTNASSSGSAVDWPGGKGFFSVVGTFGGTTVAFQYLGPDGTTYVTPTDGSLLAAGGFVFELPACKIKATVTGGTPSGLYAKAVWIPE